jgi:purine-nucleoside/S-methyl-5'-thioadenosine phosphorylase / adenosine deaminase
VIAHGAPVLYFTFRSLGAIGLPHATTTRHFPGVRPFGNSTSTSPFTPEALAALEPTGLDVGRAGFARQVHGVERARVTTGGLAGTADILVTTERRVPLAISTADCLALTAYDPSADALAVAHVGWRGTASGGAAATVAALVAAGGRPARMRVAIGPAIGPCCYEVDEPVQSLFREAYPREWEGWMQPGRPGHWRLDLWRANEELLVDAGVPRASIENARLCTACHPALFFSYRRGDHGRLVTIAGLP